MKVPPITPTGRPPGSYFPIVGIGASAGGVEAFSQILRALPADTGMGFVLILHLDPTHASLLTEILSRATSMPVAEVTDQMAVEPNHVYVIPPGVNMDIAGGILRLSPRKDLRGQHRTIDHFLQSLAEDQHFRAIGVILSGSATDGTLGLEAVKAEGGLTFAQDDTAQHTSMPKSAVAAGCVDLVLPPAAIAQEIARISRHPFLAREAEDQVEPQAVEPSLRRVLDQLRAVTGVDFTQYKRNTLYRRITRRAVLHQMEALNDYAQFLQNNPAEVEALFQDVLINVTSFFRNPEAFDVLKTKIFPALTRDRSRHDPIRVWVLGCSTGEEAYSIAIAFAEFSEISRIQVPLQIFATDLNGAGVEKARAGIYPKTIAQGISPDRLRRFFFETDGTYQISKTIRDSVVFAKHNLLTEPPFSRIDLVSCRNLLIYLEAPLQQKAVSVMHYALKPSGYLWLGNSETIGSFRDLFEVEDAKHKFYSKKAGLPRLPQTFGEAARGKEVQEQRARETVAAGADVYREADRYLLNRFAPSSVLVNSELEVIQFRGDTGLYLTPSPGKASLNLLKMLREGLLVGVRGALLKARREESPVREDGLRVRSNGGYRDVNVQVIPVKGSNAGNHPHYLVLFEEAAPPNKRRAPQVAEQLPKVLRPARKDEAAASERETVRLGQELAATREYLQSVIEQQEAANEELQSSNEEVQSANEELQSINEELETSKEEIQSSNEELATVNEELHNRNTELGQANNDFINLLASVQLAIVILGPDLRIRRFTPMAERMFNLIAADVGRPITDIHLGVGMPDLPSMLGEVIDTMSVREAEVHDKDGRWHLLRLRPYRTMDNRIDGAVLVLLDVDDLKRQQEILRRQSELLDQTNEAIFIWELDGGITYWNRGAEDTYGFTREQALGRKSYDLLNSFPQPSMFLEALRTQRQWTGELTNVRRDGLRIVVESRMMMERDSGPSKLVFETNTPVTERKIIEDNLRRQASELVAADRNKDEFLALLAHELRNPLAPLNNALQLLRQPDIAAGTMDRVRDVMGRQIQAMARMVDDLLDISRIALGRIELRKEPINLHTVVERAVEAIRANLQEREQELLLSVPSEPVILEADALRLQQILGNLLSNASKFSPAHGHIWLTVEEPRKDQETVVRVRDDGIGIAPEHLSKVFDQFMQADSSLSRAAGGLGIGLTLVRHLVRLHGGRVAVSSLGKGQGAEFVVHLPPPLQPGKEVRGLSPTPARAAVSPRTRRVLVADDNVDAADTLGMLLRQHGHDVHIVYSGRQAVEVAGSFHPEVIFLDLGMPIMDGYETARRLRERLGGKNARLVAVSGYGQAMDRQRARTAGFDDFVVKPASPEQMIDLASRPLPGEESPTSNAADN